jgi:hypothetical protein
MKVFIENADSTIWKRDAVVAEIIDAINQNNPFTINLNGEGPCATSLGLYSLLDNLCQRYDFNKSNITIETCNLIESHTEYSILCRPPLKGVATLQATEKTNKHIIKHFSNFVSRGNSLRLIIASELYFSHKEKTIQSYHTDVKNFYFDHHIGLEDVMKRLDGNTFKDRCFDLLSIAPLTLDKVQTYPILHGTKVYEIMDYYSNTFVDIANLAYFTGNTFYIDEKLWRPIVTRTPFIVQGPQNFLNNLKKLGFKTFDRWWNEGYSEDPSDHQVHGIIENIREISKWPVSKLQDLYNEMQPVLDHNYSRFMDLTAKDFKEAFGYA